MKKYIQLFKNRFSQGLAYRTDHVTITLLVIISAISSLILWLAIFKTTKSINGYGFAETLKYYLLIPIVGSITNISTETARNIKQGKYSNELLKPYKIIPAQFFIIAAKKSSYLMTSLLFYIAFIILGMIYFDLKFNFIGISLGFMIALGAFVLHFFIDLTISWIAFWMDEVWSLTHFKSILFFVFGGLSFPLDFLPENLKNLFNLLPFKYLYYIPISYIKGNNLNMFDFIFNIAELALWCFMFYILSKIVLKFGLKKYGAFGN
jgi:ABC-2 type transport system permease protein